MPLENITERILQEARGKSEEIKKEAEKKAQEIIKEGQGEAASLRREIISLAKQEGEAEKRRNLSLASLEGRNLVLLEKQKAVTEVFEQALRELLSLPPEKYRDFIKKKLLQEDLTGEEEVIVSSDDREKITNGFLTGVNQELKEKGKKGELRFSSERREIKGGFILKSNGIEINNSFPVLIEAQKDELEPLILKILLKKSNVNDQ